MNLKDIIGETTDYDKKLALEVKKSKSWCKWRWWNFDFWCLK
ncbi:hypothetical protein AALA90_09395 [Lachnospiraceae bacterium 38-10]